MVPFSFKSKLSYSRVMNEYSIGVLDDGINGFLDHWVLVSIIDRHAGGAGSLESGAFALSCLLAFLMVIPAWAKICKNSNEFAKIQVNPTKSNQIQPLFFPWAGLGFPPKSGLRRHVASFQSAVVPAHSTAAPHRGRHPIRLSTKNSQPSTKAKITKRTQFKNRTTRHPRQLRRTTC
jgi:hypothetical protein